MDERQAQITEGAGLEDSRINTDFLDFLSKWSTPFFVLLLIVAAGMFGYRKLREMRIAAVDQAFLEYDLATAGGNPSPFTLKTLGEDYRDTRSVGLMAELDLADIYLNAARMGLEPGSTLDPQTGEPAPESVLNAEGISSYLSSAGAAYGKVLAAAEKERKPVFGVAAAFGSAAVLGSQGDTAGAKAMYERAGRLASGAGLPLLAKVAADRAERVGSLPEVTIYEADQLPELPSNDPTLDAITGPGTGDDAAPGITTDEPTETPATETPATETPTTEAPTAEAPAEGDAATTPEDPAADAAPTETAPTETAPAEDDPADDAGGDEPPLGS